MHIETLPSVYKSYILISLGYLKGHSGSIHANFCSTLWNSLTCAGSLVRSVHSQHLHATDISKIRVTVF